MRLRLRFPPITLAAIALINLYFLIHVRLNDYNGTNWQTAIYSDGKGYYQYLRAAFIHHNLSQQDPKPGFMRQTPGGPVIKFYAGTALAESPFFFIALFQSASSDEPLDGYEYNFQRMMAMAGLIYCLLGLFCIDRLLRALQVKEWIRSLSLILITYGTNLFYYAILEPSMSHVYSFAAIAVFLYSGFEYFGNFKTRYLIVASISLGLIILIRPTNGCVILMLPFMSGGWRSLKLFLRNYTHLILSVTIVLSFLFMQMYLWYLQCGRWWVWSYTGEGFYFSHPEIANVLFSYKKGFFIYTPLALVAVLGLIPTYRKNRVAFYSLLATLLAVIYITSSWWDWNYGNSFGMRPLVDFYALFALLLVVLVSSLRSKWTKMLFIPIGFFFVLSIIQTYQYYNNILQHYSMDKSKYWYVFLKTEDGYKNVLGGNSDLAPHSLKRPVLLASTHDDFEKKYNGWQTDVIAADPANSGGKSAAFGLNEIGLYYNLPYDSISSHPHKIFIEASLRRYEFVLHSSSAAVMEASVERGGEHIFDYEFKLNDFPDNHPQQWRAYHYSFTVPIPDEPFDNITIQIRNPARQKFLIDDFEIRIYRIYD